METSLRFQTSSQGKKNVAVIDEYTFSYHKVCGKSTYFRCMNFNRGCRARVTVVNYNVDTNEYSRYDTNSIEHNHPPKPEKVKKEMPSIDCVF